MSQHPRIIAERSLTNGKTIQVIPLTYGRARLCVGTDPEASGLYDDAW